MPRITFQKASDQPTGTKRLLNELRDCLSNRSHDTFLMAVAFAKIGPLLRLDQAFESFLGRPNATIKAVFGIDQKGTSQQALDYALSAFTETRIVHISGRFNPTFHPKIYIFSGTNSATAFLGSNNLTVGGTETNFETNIKMEMKLPDDKELYDQILQCWRDSERVSVKLTLALLGDLILFGALLDETQQRSDTHGGARGKVPALASITAAFPMLQVLPPSPIPREAIAARLRPQLRRPRAPHAAPQVPVPAQNIGAQTLVIQVVPHHNGEVFLSKMAVDQSPEFFGWPFTGRTVPKKSTNEPYQQRIPDPVVNLRVYGARGVTVKHQRFGLNTVYYSAKSEIRITVPPNVVRATPAYSILVMRKADNPDLDYDIEILTDKSPEYATYLSVCNQEMPSGGKSRPRKFGWL